MKIYYAENTDHTIKCMQSQLTLDTWLKGGQTMLAYKFPFWDNTHPTDWQKNDMS